ELPLLDEFLRLRQDLYLVETKPECHKNLDPELEAFLGPHSRAAFAREWAECRGKPQRVQLGLKYHRKTAKPKPQGGIVSACRLFTLKVRANFLWFFSAGGGLRAPPQPLSFSINQNIRRAKLGPNY